MVFADFLDPARAQAFDAELSWYAGLLGGVRDREVQRARFTAAIAELPEELVLGPVASRIEQHLLTEQQQQQQQQQQKTLDKAMNSKRYFALLTESRGWVTDPPFTTLGSAEAREAAIRGPGRSAEGHRTPDRRARRER